VQAGPIRRTSLRPSCVPDSPKASGDPFVRRIHLFDTMYISASH
jgi:hypothetical protein